MRQKFLVIILFIFLYGTPLFAQNKYTFSQFASETVDFIEQPLKWDGNDYLKLGLITVPGCLSMFVDQPIRDAVLRDNQKYYKSVPIEFGRIYGELYSPIVFFTGFGIYSVITGDIKARKIAYEIGQASLYAGGINYILKVALGRARPNLNMGNGTYRPFTSFTNGDYHSMPGGHSTAAFVISTVLSRNINPVWLKILIYAPAVLTMTSRVYQDWHWTSDNLIGAAFGYYIGNWVVDKHEKVDKSDNKDTKHGLLERIHLQPNITGDFYGLNLNIQLL
jgi:membrane-associated phospholipid phosphatase